MTTAELVRLLLRRWYLSVAGAACSLVVLVLAVQQPPVYFTQLDVVVLPPAETSQTNTLRDGPYLLAPLAGLIVDAVNGGLQAQTTATDSTTLYGEGVLNGSRVRLRNRGTQWQPVYDAGVIDVQVVGPDPGAVVARAEDLVAELDAALVARQVDAGVVRSSRATLESSPTDPVLQQVGASRSRAALSIGLLGALLTFLTVVGVDRRLARRRSGTHPSPGPAVDDVAAPDTDRRLVLT